MKKVAILQSNYIPWKGYFDIIAADVDVACDFTIFGGFTANYRDGGNMVRYLQGILQ